MQLDNVTDKQYINPSVLTKEKKKLNKQEKLQHNNFKFLFAKFQLFLEEPVRVPFLIDYYTSNAKWFQWNNYCNMALSRVSRCRTSGC